MSITHSIGFFDNYIIDVFSISGILSFRVCSKGFREEVISALESGDGRRITECRRRLVSGYFSGQPPEKFPFPEDKFVLLRYIDGIEEAVEKYGEQLKTPKCDSVSLSDLPPCSFESSTIAEKMTAEYARISMLQVQELNYLVFRLLLADAVKYNLSSSAKGIEWLNAANNEMFGVFDRQQFLASLYI